MAFYGPGLKIRRYGDPSWGDLLIKIIPHLGNVGWNIHWKSQYYSKLYTWFKIHVKQLDFDKSRLCSNWSTDQSYQNQCIAWILRVLVGQLDLSWYNKIPSIFKCDLLGQKCFMTIILLGTIRIVLIPVMTSRSRSLILNGWINWISWIIKNVRSLEHIDTLPKIWMKTVTQASLPLY